MTKVQYKGRAVQRHPLNQVLPQPTEHEKEMA